MDYTAAPLEKLIEEFGKLNVVANTAAATTYKGVLNWTLTSSADN